MSKLLLTIDQRGSNISPDSFDDFQVEDNLDIQLISWGYLHSATNRILFALSLGEMDALQLPFYIMLIIEALKKSHEKKYKNKFSNFEVEQWQFIPDNDSSISLSSGVTEKAAEKATDKIDRIDLTMVAEMAYSNLCNQVDVPQIKEELVACGFKKIEAQEYLFLNEKMGIRALIIFQQLDMEVEVGIQDRYSSSWNKVYKKTMPVNAENINLILQVITNAIKTIKEKRLTANEDSTLPLSGDK